MKGSRSLALLLCGDGAADGFAGWGVAAVLADSTVAGVLVAAGWAGVRKAVVVASDRTIAALNKKYPENVIRFLCR
jgi:hypothetical protein